MKKNEYVSPEVEIVEITEKFGLMDAVSGGDLDGELGNGDVDLGGF